MFFFIPFLCSIFPLFLLTHTPSHVKDLRLQLGATDYGNLLQTEPSPIATSTFADRLTDRLVDEFNYIRDNAVAPLSKFLDYITQV